MYMYRDVMWRSLIPFDSRDGEKDKTLWHKRFGGGPLDIANKDKVNNQLTIASGQ